MIKRFSCVKKNKYLCLMEDIIITQENLEYICQRAEETGLSNSDVINTIIDIYRDENR